MIITILGTSSGTPTKLRNVSATAIKFQKRKAWCLIDCGEGTQHQLLKTKLSLRHLAAICITHVHGDHCYGLPGLIASAAMSGRTEPLTVIGPQAVLDWLLATRKMSESRSHFELNLLAIESAEFPVQSAGFEISVHPLSHRVPSHAYQFTETSVHAALDTQKLEEDGIPRGPAWGQLQQGQDVVTESSQPLRANDYLIPEHQQRTIIIAGDNDEPGLLTEVKPKPDVVFHEATYTEAIKQKVGPWPQHSSAEQVAQWAHSVQLKNLVLTHFSPRYATKDNTIPEIETEAKQHYSENLFLANDFDQFELKPGGIFQRISQ